MLELAVLKMSSCGICNTRVNVKSKVRCKTCSKEFHHTCAGIEEKLLQDYTNNKNSFFCSKCKQKGNENVSLEFDLATVSADGNDLRDHPSLSDIFKVVQQILSSQNTLQNSFDVFKSEVCTMQERITKNEEGISANQQKNEAALEKITILTEENCFLKNKINEIEKLANVNCLEITGVPEPRGENVFVTSQLICAALGFRLEFCMVNNCYRVHLPDNPTKSKIIIKFTQKCHRDEIIRCRKVKRDFNTSCLDVSLSKLIHTPEIIYVNELLTSFYRKLLVKAKEFKKLNKIKYLWVKNGNMYMRRSETSQIVIIRNELSFNDV